MAKKIVKRREWTKEDIRTLKTLARVSQDSRMSIDGATRRNLELVETLAGSRAGSLLAVIDRTVTSGGARELANLDQAQRSPGHVCEYRAGMGIRRFLKNKIVAFEAERISAEFKRDVIVAAERKSRASVKHALRRFGSETDAPGREHVG